MQVFLTEREGQTDGHRHTDRQINTSDLNVARKIYLHVTGWLEGTIFLVEGNMNSDQTNSEK